MSSSFRQDSKGLVSFMVTIIMMLVISLIVIGFTQVTSRNRREALDRQLSTQAFYAAESGVNEAVKYLRAHPGAKQTDCNGVQFPQQTLGTDPIVKYTCILVDPFVPDIITNVNTMSSTVFPIDTVDSAGAPATPTELLFTWTPPQGGSTSVAGCPAAAGSFAKSLAYACNYGLLRVDVLVPPADYSGGAVLLNSLTGTFYMQATTGGGSVAVASFGSPKATIVAGKCVALGSCQAKMVLGVGARSQHYYVRLTTFYKDAEKVTIDANNGGGSLYFVNAQASIDATGKAQDVLRRIKVRARLSSPDAGLPEGALQSQAAVCKKFTAAPGLPYSNSCP